MSSSTCSFSRTALLNLCNIVWGWKDGRMKGWKDGRNTLMQFSTPHQVFADEICVLKWSVWSHPHVNKALFDFQSSKSMYIFVLLAPWKDICNILVPTCNISSTSDYCLWSAVQLDSTFQCSHLPDIFPLAEIGTTFWKISWCKGFDKYHCDLILTPTQYPALNW